MECLWLAGLAAGLQAWAARSPWASVIRRRDRRFPSRRSLYAFDLAIKVKCLIPLRARSRPWHARRFGIRHGFHERNNERTIRHHGGFDGLILVPSR